MTALAQHVDTASDAVRAANHATMRAPLDGPESYAVVGGLTELAGRLPQLLDYLSRSLRRADPAAHYDDRGRDPSGALHAAHGHLDDACAAVVQAGEHLSTAHNHLGHLGRHTASED
ncbi:hypothetical protein PHK61_06530 [Actinomycetospora lutea]|uniref:hypothetical protein n=1 Tax=Actinomycetospora lutea TaxID=663604 RepID=UPI002366E0BF|nr:hypothetical protein [Actinomycetospora lutea]MDD7938071.1 hypothetical protein [Actinomycetospora lutea]